GGAGSICGDLALLGCDLIQGAQYHLACDGLNTEPMYRLPILFELSPYFDIVSRPPLRLAFFKVPRNKLPQRCDALGRCSAFDGRCVGPQASLGQNFGGLQAHGLEIATHDFAERQPALLRPDGILHEVARPPARELPDPEPSQALIEDLNVASAVGHT